MDVGDLHGVRWFWGLTCDFWAKNAKNNFRFVGKEDGSGLQPSFFPVPIPGASPQAGMVRAFGALSANVTMKTRTAKF